MTDAGSTLPRHLYVHVPLCRAKCAYCDFFSLTPDEIAASPDAIVDALVNQTRAWAERGLEPAGLDTLYIGGGTPTMLGDGLATLVSALAIWAGVTSVSSTTRRRITSWSWGSSRCRRGSSSSSR